MVNTRASARIPVSARSKPSWFFDVNAIRPPRTVTELQVGRVKVFLYECLHRCITRHDLYECFQMLKLLPKDTTIDPYVLLRFIFILLESNETESVNKNVVIYLETLLSKLDLCKPDAFVEYLAYFIRHDRVDDARELFSQRHRYMSHRIHRPLPYVDINLTCYEFLLNYLKWYEQASVQKTLRFDLSIQGWIVNAIDQLKSTNSNHEYFVLCILRALLYYGFSKKAYLFSSEFQRNNPENISAQLLHNQLLDRLAPPGLKTEFPEVLSSEERNAKRLADLESINNFSLEMENEDFHEHMYPIDEERESILNNLRVLDQSRKEILEQNIQQDDLVGAFKDLMDGLEIIEEISNIERWRAIQIVLDNIFASGDKLVRAGTLALWRTRYRPYWKSIDLMSLTSDRCSEQDMELIRQVYESLLTRLDKSRRPILPR